jgi:uncharacterized protein
MEMTFQFYLTQVLPAIAFKSAQAVVDLVAEGGTVPFIARYRKEKTGNLDEVQIRSVVECHETFKEVIKRKAFLIKEIGEQGNLTEEIKKRIELSHDLGELEEIYRPFKKKKKTKATLARESGLEPLATWIWLLGHGTLKEETTLEVKAKDFVNIAHNIATYDAALTGAKDIIIERLANMPELRAKVHDDYMKHGKVFSKKTKHFKENSKYEMYAEFEETVKSLMETKSSHRYMAMRRGWQEEELSLEVKASDEMLLADFTREATTVPNSAVGEFLASAAKMALTVYVVPSVVNEVHRLLKQKSDEDAIKVFAENVRRVLLGSPFGSKIVLGVDPGLRTGCKVALVDKSGHFISHTVVHIHGETALDKAKAMFQEVVKTIKIEVIAVGNGTAGREAEAFFRKLVKELGQEIPVIMVNESGASVYSASEIARQEFPDLDLTVKGAISIARRLQDPLSELVKVDPKSIGVGQYQHDVNQAALKKGLEAVVESCVNNVGVDLNTASAPLLSFVAGIGPAVAQNIIDYRKNKGLFQDRSELLSIPRFSTKVFEQSAGFLRIRGGKVTLDNTGIHPERYPAIKDMANELGVGITDIIGVGAKKLLNLRTKWAGIIGEYTFNDIVNELEKPGRDPRDPFKVFQFKDDIFEVKDLKEGMVCPGVVTNVTNFGAFVDVGVHQDGLVHISEMSNQFVEDPRKVVNPGDQVTVRVISVDLVKNQIGFSMILDPAQPRATARPQRDDARTNERAADRNGERKFERRPDNRGDKRDSKGQDNRGSDQRNQRGFDKSGVADRQNGGGHRSQQRGSFGGENRGGGKGNDMQKPRTGGGSPFNNPFAALQGIPPNNSNKK